MDITTVIGTVIATVAGSTAIAYTTIYLQTKHRKRSLFNALINEVEQNHSTTQALKQEQSDYMWVSQRLHTAAYQSFRLAGEVMSLPESTRECLMFTYGRIDWHNSYMDRDVTHAGTKGILSWSTDDLCVRLVALREGLRQWQP